MRLNTEHRTQCTCTAPVSHTSRQLRLTLHSEVGIITHAEVETGLDARYISSTNDVQHKVLLTCSLRTHSMAKSEQNSLARLEETQ